LWDRLSFPMEAPFSRVTTPGEGRGAVGVLHVPAWGRVPTSFGCQVSGASLYLRTGQPVYAPGATESDGAASVPSNRYGAGAGPSQPAS
jgi:hypothetical protein